MICLRHVITSVISRSAPLLFEEETLLTWLAVFQWRKLTGGCLWSFLSRMMPSRWCQLRMAAHVNPTGCINFIPGQDDVDGKGFAIITNSSWTYLTSNSSINLINSFKSYNFHNMSCKRKMEINSNEFVDCMPHVSFEIS